MVVEAGNTYDIVIEEEQSNEWTGPLGVTHLGDVDVVIPKAKKGDQFRVKVLRVETNQWTGKKQAVIEDL